jgi:uncharacterized protein YdhG (YjbR/CyaY superfamily)
MARTDFKSVDEYIKAQPSELQPILRRVRSIIRKAVPEATEMISYQIPAYKLAGRALVYFAAWKAHYSIYPATDPLMAAFKGELTPYRVSKGTLRFPLSEPVPVKLIERIARFRAEETLRSARAKTGRK